MAVGEALPLVTGLRKLRMGGNAIGPVGCEKVFIGLGANRSILWLEVRAHHTTPHHTTPHHTTPHPLPTCT